MSDRIIVERIAVHAHHGVHAAEAELGQRFYISLVCEADLSEAGRSDDWNHTICYARLTALAVAVATGRRFRLIEALAAAIAEEALKTFPRIEAITVRIEKPSAPLPAVFGTVAVEITRRANADLQR